MNRSPLRRLAMATVMFAAGGMLVVPIVRAEPSSAQKTPADQAEQLLRDARSASAEADYTGVVQVEWVDGAGHRHRDSVEARSVGGVLELQDHRGVYGHDDQRLVQSDGGYMSMGNSHAAGELPSPTPKWDLRITGAHHVAGRVTLVIAASDADTGTARERVYVDRSTHLVLRREQLDSRGHVQRAIGFVQVNQANLGNTKPKLPRSQQNLQPARLRDLPKGYLAPKRVGDRYELLGQYRQPDGTVQLFYSDGIFGLSMFEQRGEINWDALPPGARVRSIGGHEARQYATPGGEVLVWTAAGTIFTSVSDAPHDEIEAWVVDFLPKEHSSAVDSIAKFVIGPFGWE